MVDKGVLLIIEDDANTCKLLSQLCENLGYTPQVLDKAIFLPRIMKQEAPPVAIILDINMPGWGGVQMAQLIRKHERTKTPIIVYSAKPQNELDQLAAEIGAEICISKSRGPTELLERLKTLN